MRRIPVLLLVATGLLIVGCGSNNNMTNNPGGQPPTQAPPPAPAPGTAQFSETMLPSDGSGTVDGTVTVDTSGNGTMTLTAGGAASTAYAIQFCPFASGSCNSVGTFNSDANGAGTANFTMGHGGFAGVFELTNNGDVAFLSAFNIPTNGSSLQAAFVRAGSVSGGMPNETGAGFGIGSDPLSNGNVTVNGGSSVSLSVVGAAASQNYDVSFCYNGGGASCTLLGPLSTDASGGGQASFDLSQTVGASNANAGVFFLSSGSSPTIQFVSGFTVP